MRPTALLAAALALAIGLGGCGSSNKPTIPHDAGAVLLRHLQKARDAAGDPNKCDRLNAAVAAAQSDVQSLPSSVDKDTRQSLTNGVDNLQESARSECANATTTDTTPTTTETTPPTTTETTPPTTTETTPPTTTETTPPTTQTQTTPTQVPTQTVPGNGNGNGNGGTKGNNPGNAPGQPKRGKGPKSGKGPKK